MTYLDSTAHEIRSYVDEDMIPPDSDSLFLIYALLARAKGIHTTTEDVHDAWAAWMQSRDEQHESLVPFHTLDLTKQREDEPFRDAIIRAAENLSAGSGELK